ncbi:glycine receptor subunit alpha-1-like isoform X2 [Panonychus citri]|uniref:glycine receptor subunit alpha-1-like isoform X2 n=1 Tax=Panonychus citri TaxID=50023 RepID=UPI0023082F8B|nr:glycine receptor subunit alpha-1-like isoform X2 [Panonychus citri]
MNEKKSSMMMMRSNYSRIKFTKTYVADIFISQSWKDHRLKIPDELTNTSSNYRLLPLKWLDYMWRPDSFFKNAKQVKFQEMTIPNHYIWLYSDKRILYMVKLTLLLSCAMKFQSYPHDTQTCELKIESLSYTTDDLIFDWETDSPLVVEPAIELPQHELVDYKLADCSQMYSSGNFTCVEVVFTLKRRLGYYIFHTYIPTCLIVIMSWISFWIKPEAVPARVTLCVTSLLTLSTQHAQSQKSLPPVSYIKAIDIFMSYCTIFVFASLMEYALVNILMTADEKLNNLTIGPTAATTSSTGPTTNIYHQYHHNHQLTGHHHSHQSSLRSPTTPNSPLTTTTTTTIANTGSNSNNNNNSSAINDNSATKFRSSTRQGSLRSAVFVKKRDRALIVDKVSRWGFPSTFILLNIVYWSVYLDWS